MQRDLADELVDRVRSAALSSDGHQRSWDAVRTAALLRKNGESGRALELLDDVAARFGYEDVVSAAYACAVAIHCDRGNPDIGITVGRGVWRCLGNVELGNALARAYWERFEQTGDVNDRSAWNSFKMELDSIAAAAV